ncbi:MAG: uncharacterized protein KVP18_002875 [Porospora cf. gigantea A]|uniref:uncharacterized protein n=1 Tax=Porospora cf. gigantea A TaxID=2853593 RepID=UPI00355A8617|nr:MAG: hypothetical protein KVP18_002875 [Porospora cf. gigantea A]
MKGEVRPVTEIPDVPVALMKGYTNLQLFFSDRVGLIVTWPGAFMPGSKVSGVSASFLEDLDRLSGKIREKVDFLGLCVVNDPFVAQSWSRVEIANIDIVCDPECILTEHLGVAKVVEPLGLRANRAEAFLLGPEKQVRRLDIPFLSAEAIHECLLQKIITPWKSFVVADQPEDIIQELRANGYACEPNWQLHLTITDDRHSFLASHENLASGLTWLFDEIQKGDDVVLWIPAHLLSWVKADTFSRVPDSCRLNLVVHNPRRVPLDHGFNWIFDGVWSKHRVPGVHTRGEVSSIMVLGDFVPSLEEPLSDRCV